MLRSRIRLIALLLALLVPTAIVSAAETVTLGSFQVDLVSHEQNADGTDTFTYAITAASNAQALSHWVLGIDTCLEHLVSPQAGPYTTVTTIASCDGATYLCQESTYTVLTGNDPTLGIHGIKFEDGSQELAEGTTHVFQITVDSLAYVEPVAVGIKNGRALPQAKIDGPVCGEGTAISLASVDAGMVQTGMLLPLLLTAVVLMAGATLFVWRREVVAVRVK